MPSSSYVAIDLKSFYASVECIERGLDPLTAKLVVADPERTNKTICLAVTPALKAYGISGRCRLFELEEKLREIRRATGENVRYIIAPPQMQHYIDVSSRIHGIYQKYVSRDDIHVYSIDEVFIDMTDYLRYSRMSARDFTKTIILDVLASTGITATAGIGTNLYLAKIAMDIVSKHIEPDCDGVRIAELDEMNYRYLLWDHRPLTDFWRVGHGTAVRLERHGILTMGDVARTSIHNAERLYNMFGVDAELLIDHAWGYEPCTISDIKSYRPETHSISSGQVLPHPYDFEKGRIVVREMTDSLALELVGKGLSTDTLTLDIGYDRIGGDVKYNGELHTDRYGRTVPKPEHGTASLGTHTSSSRRISAAMISLYDRITAKHLLIKRFTLAACNVLAADCEQCDIFTAPAALEREHQIQCAMLDIRKRYGKNAILRCTSLEEGATAIERNGQIGGHGAERRRDKTRLQYE